MDNILRNMKDVIELERTTTIYKDGSYIVSYPHILSYMASLDSIKEQDVVRGAHMVYGWMPTILELYTESSNISLSEAAGILNEAKENGVLSAEQLQQLAKVINNSIVGASKLLHFVNPNHFAIWDSKIYTFIYGQKPYNYRVADVDSYINYLELLKHLSSDTRFSQFHHSVNNKVGYDVSGFRALELMMFLNAPVLSLGE